MLIIFSLCLHIITVIDEFSGGHFWNNNPSCFFYFLSCFYSAGKPYALLSVFFFIFAFRSLLDLQEGTILKAQLCHNLNSITLIVT